MALLLNYYGDGATRQRDIYRSIYLPTYLPTYLSNYLSIYLSTYLFIYPSIYLSIHPSIHPSIHLSIYLSNRLRGGPDVGAGGAASSESHCCLLCSVAWPLRRSAGPAHPPPRAAGPAHPHGPTPTRGVTRVRVARVARVAPPPPPAAARRADARRGSRRARPGRGGPRSAGRLDSRGACRAGGRTNRNVSRGGRTDRNVSRGGTHKPILGGTGTSDARLVLSAHRSPVFPAWTPPGRLTALTIPDPLFDRCDHSGPPVRPP